MMNRVTTRSLRALACAAVLLAAGIAVHAGEDSALVKEGRKLIGANAENICRFAHAPSTYTYISNEYVGHKKTKDGFEELTYKFAVKGNFKKQTMQIAFYFKNDGKFDFLRARDYTTAYEPFKKLSSSYLKQLRGQMAKRPAVAGNTELLRTVDNAGGQELCEMYLKQAQMNPIK